MSFSKEALKELEQLKEESKQNQKDAPPIKRYSRDDTGHAERFVDMYGLNTLYNFPNNDFYHYNAKYWEKDDAGQIRKKIDAVMKAIKDEPLDIPPGASENEINRLMKEKAKYVKKTRTTATKDALNKEVRHHFPVAIEEFDTDFHALNVQNGWIDLRTGELKPHDPDKRFSKIAGTVYDPQAKGKLWENFIHTVMNGDEELIQFIQTLVGYSLIGGNMEQIIIFAYGNKGSNGKSVFLYVLEKLLGHYQTSIAAEDLMQKREKTSGHNDSIEGLAGARVVTSSEPEKGYHLSEAIIKRMTGNDTQTASFKNKSSFRFIPQHIIWLACNYIPTMNAGAADDSIWRRVIILPFDVEIPRHKQIKNLKEKITETELAAVMNWAIEGLKNYLKNGLVIPEVVKKATQEERESMDVIGDFLTEELTKVPDGTIKTSEVHEIYVLWSKAHGKNYFMSQTMLTRELRSRGFMVQRKMDGNYLLGFAKTDYFPSQIGNKKKFN